MVNGRLTRNRMISPEVRSVCLLISPPSVHSSSYPYGGFQTSFIP